MRKLKKSQYLEVDPPDVHMIEEEQINVSFLAARRKASCTNSIVILAMELHGIPSFISVSCHTPDDSHPLLIKVLHPLGYISSSFLFFCFAGFKFSSLMPLQDKIHIL